MTVCYCLMILILMVSIGLVVPARIPDSDAENYYEHVQLLGLDNTHHATRRKRAPFPTDCPTVKCVYAYLEYTWVNRYSLTEEGCLREGSIMKQCLSEAMTDSYSMCRHCEPLELSRTDEYLNDIDLSIDRECRRYPPNDQCEDPVVQECTENYDRLYDIVHAMADGSEPYTMSELRSVVNVTVHCLEKVQGEGLSLFGCKSVKFLQMRRNPGEIALKATMWVEGCEMWRKSGKCRRPVEDYNDFCLNTELTEFQEEAEEYADCMINITQSDEKCENISNFRPGLVSELIHYRIRDCKMVKRIVGLKEKLGCTNTNFIGTDPPTTTGGPTTPQSTTTQPTTTPDYVQQ